VDARRHHYVLLASLLVVTLGTILVPSEEGRAAAAKAPTFVGSVKCKECHDKIYATWRQTIRAKAIQEVTEHPQAIQGDWTQPVELRTFTRRM
jgi:Cytochrome c554 and c-prime